jgi:soluble lytic murein transglycosylase-like protein
MIHHLALPLLWLTLFAAAGPAAAQEAAAAAASRADLKAIVRTTAAKAGMPPELADAVATVESNYNVAARGYDGEVGMMQILPSTARMLGFYGTNQELADPATNARYAVEYLSSAWRKASGDICTTVMKYRAGHGETRFSHKSVAYCVRVRELLAAGGYPVTGIVPPATFGDPGGTVASAGRVRGSKVTRSRRSKIDWARYERRIKEIDARMSSGLTIMR